MVGSAELPPELLQILGSHLSTAELRSARLVCKSWATALAVCMPAITMSLPQQASGSIFRQPLVLCSSSGMPNPGSFDSNIHHTSYTAAPRPVSAAVAAAAAAAPMASAVAVDLPLPFAAAALPLGAANGQHIVHKPSPFATEDGQCMAPVSDLVTCDQGTAGMQVAAIEFLDTPFGSYAAASAVAEAETAALAPSYTAGLLQQASECLPSWSSLPSAGLRTCSSLQQLNLKLAGAPPTPDDIKDLKALPRLTHLSFQQLGAGSDAKQQSVANDVSAQHDSVAPEHDANGPHSSSSSTASSDSSSSSSASRSPLLVKLPSITDWATAAAAAFKGFHISSPGAGSSSSGTSAYSPGPCSISTSTSSSRLAGSTGALSNGCKSSCSRKKVASCSSPGAPSVKAPLSYGSLWGTDSADDSDSSASQHTRRATSPPIGIVPPALFQAQHTKSVSCSVLTAAHVEALAQLPHLSSLELQPTGGSWDTAGLAALLQLTMLSGLTRLSLAWGDIDAAAAPWSEREAIQEAHGPQLPLQRCLAGLTQLRELELRGHAVVDIVLLQLMQQLHRLSGQALHVVNSDVMVQLQQQGQPPGTQAAVPVQIAADPVPNAAADLALAAAAEVAEGLAGPAIQAAFFATAQGQSLRTSKWAALPNLDHVEVVHPASDISCLLQYTRTPNLRRAAFVARGPSDFARLLGQHGKLQVLHLVFLKEEPWHSIAVVRLPTALPGLRSLSLEGSFWLPNSLIVGLGVMEVPIEELSLTCRLAMPCLQRLQQLKQLKKLSLHHVPSSSGQQESSSGGNRSNGMLQLPASMLPPQLRELEMTNGWVLM